MAIGKKNLVSVRSTRILGRKRVFVSSNCIEASPLSSPSIARMCNLRGRKRQTEQSNRLESLSQDVLVRVLCNVDHSDLKHLLLVSKFVSKTALIARELHFKYSTPLAKRFLAEDCDLNAPMQRRGRRPQIDASKLASLAVSLFASPDAQKQKNDSPTEM